MDVSGRLGASVWRKEEAVTTPIAKVIGFSGHAHANPSRYVPKAPSEPVGSERSESFPPLTLSLSSVYSAASFRSETVAAGCNSLLGEWAAKILPDDRLLTGTFRIFGCQEPFGSQTSSHILPWEVR